ncbi:MAG TPA: hypothetical protein VFV23_05695 [Verrucomicrobiae bacterium]|nr:hypothetical protein [Verrucomicrobiae bacterium]
MDKANRVLKWILIIVAIAAVIALIVITFFLDSIVRKGVVTIGPKLTQTTVELDSVHISLLTGSAKFDGLVIGNPEGYKTKQAISIGTAAAGVNPLSLTKDKIIVRSVKIVAPEITFEGDPFSGNNLAQIRDNIAGAQRNTRPVATSTNAAVPPAKAGKKLEVDDLLISGAKVHAVLTGMGGKEMDVTIPAIHLTNLGKNKEGITAADLSRRVLDALTVTTIKSVAAAVADSKIGGKDVEQIKKGVQDLIGK